MQLITVGNDFKYELEKLCRLFLPFEKFMFSNELASLDENDDYALCSAEQKDGSTLLFVKLRLFGKTTERNDNIIGIASEQTELCERRLALMLFDCFVSVTGYRSPWGILTGVRPAKLIGKLISSDSEEGAVSYFENELLVSEKKTKLCLKCYKKEERIISESTDDSFSLYISVPFCPSRCTYCSFVSHSVEQAKKLIPKYVELLCKELEYTADIVKRVGLSLKTVYIGGGTPTTLSAEQLTTVMDTVKRNFDLSTLSEYTVEAGRPDTVTEEKLVAIKNGGATRISINPQTMNDDVLSAIGRRHTVEETVEAFKLARKCGFNNINTDLIAGLDGDTYESFRNSVDRLIALSPENVTVHSLSMKRSSKLNGLGRFFDVNKGYDAEKMVDYAYEKLSESGIEPYYMYRQSKTIGNLENVGYAKSGFEGKYNVYIMDETHTILACGASAVTKLREPGGPLIERIFNYKYPYEYISQFDTVIQRKDGILDFYSKYGKR